MKFIEVCLAALAVTTKVVHAQGQEGEELDDGGGILDINVNELFEVEEDPLLDNDWPRRYETTFEAIRKGATENNSEGGYWLDGTYATLENRLGDLDFEVNLNLHNPI